MKTIKITRAQLDEIKGRYPDIAELLETLATVNPTQIEKLVGYDLVLVEAPAPVAAPTDPAESGTSPTDQADQPDLFKATFMWPAPDGAVLRSADGYEGSLIFGVHQSSFDENQCRRDCLAAGKAHDANALVMLGEKGKDETPALQLYKHEELYLFIFGTPKPNGDTLGASENWQKIAATYGITKLVLVLFNDSPTSIAVSEREAYISKMCGYVKHWGKNCVLLVGLECSENMSVAEVQRLVDLCHKYSIQRVVVGSSYPSILQYKGVAGCEFWVETRNLDSMQSPAAGDQYVADCQDVMKQTGEPVWAGEAYKNTDSDECKRITRKLIAIGCVGIGTGNFT